MELLPHAAREASLERISLGARPAKIGASSETLPLLSGPTLLMLRTLVIRDFVIVDAIELDLAAGFTVFTGETGAGKSILIDALTLALGGRGDASVVREGAARADIAAEFAGQFKIGRAHV